MEGVESRIKQGWKQKQGRRRRRLAPARVSKTPSRLGGSREKEELLSLTHFASLLFMATVISLPSENIELVIVLHFAYPAATLLLLYSNPILLQPPKP